MPLRPFQLSLGFIFPLAAVLGLFALALLPLVDDLTRRWFLLDLDTHSQMVAAFMREPTLDYLTLQDADGMRSLLDRSANCCWRKTLASLTGASRNFGTT